MSLAVAVHTIVEVAYNGHSNSKSHAGAFVVIVDVEAVHCRSTKQKIVTKSSTEAELVGLSDSCNQGRRFLLHCFRLSNP
jgi:hypothetical protein